MAAVSAVGFLLAGFVQNALICLGISIVLMIGVMVVLKLVFGKKKAA